MNTIRTISLGFTLVTILFITTSFLLCTPDKSLPPVKEAPKGFAVVELFTSEGCSSCPPADKLLEQWQQLDSNRVFVLAFHVDYWDHQGWKDRFSHQQYTERQQQYASQMQLQTIYTPQLVVNGTSEYVGSNQLSISKALAAQLQQPYTGHLQLSCTINGQQLSVQHNAANNGQSELVVALVQKQAASRVKAGENAGRALAHVQIVRALTQVSLQEKAAATLTLPADFSKSGYEVTGFIQNKTTGQITDAARYHWQE